MPTKKKKYNSRFPPARIKKIMQTDEDVGKVAAAVPVIISRSLELFIESLIKSSCNQTKHKNARTLTCSHIKQAIQAEKQYSFLKDLVKSVPEVSAPDDEEVDDESKSKQSNKRSKLSKSQGKVKKKKSTNSSSEESNSEEPGTSCADDDDDEENSGTESAPQKSLTSQHLDQSNPALSRLAPDNETTIGSAGKWYVPPSTSYQAPNSDSFTNQYDQKLSNDLSNSHQSTINFSDIGLTSRQSSSLPESYSFQQNNNHTQSHSQPHSYNYQQEGNHT